MQLSVKHPYPNSIDLIHLVISLDTLIMFLHTLKMLSDTSCHVLDILVMVLGTLIMLSDTSCHVF